MLRADQLIEAINNFIQATPPSLIKPLRASPLGGKKAMLAREKAESEATILAVNHGDKGISTPSGKDKPDKNIESPTSRSAISTSKYSGRFEAKQVISISLIKREIAPPCIFTPIQESSPKNLTGTEMLILVSGFTL